METTSIYLKFTFTGSKVILWNSLSSLSEANLEKMEDGLHMPIFVLKQAVLVSLFNYLCSQLHSSRLIKNSCLPTPTPTPTPNPPPSP